jgi:hypothetical protein
LILHLIASGLRRVFIGLESGNTEELTHFAKRATLEETRQALLFLSDLGLPVRTGFIMFTPYSTFENLRANLEFMKQEGFLASTADLTTRLELYTGAVEITRLRRDNLLTDNPWNNPYAYRFKDYRIEAPALALSNLRALNRPYHYWESIHMARLVAAGALLTPAVCEHNVIYQKAQILNKDIYEMWDFLAQRNQEFFLAVLELAEKKWDELKFSQLVTTYIDGYQSQVGATCDSLVRAFLLETKKVGVDVIY